MDIPVYDEINLPAMQAEAAAFQARHPRRLEGPSPLPKFQADRMKLRILAETIMQRHLEMDALKNGRR
jgi:hypothetical protein